MKEIYSQLCSKQGADTGHAGTAARRWVDQAGGPSAQKLLQKLRWCTLGPQFNWTERVYEWHEPYVPLPEELRRLATGLVASVAGSLPERVAGESALHDVGTGQTASYMQCA